MSASEGQASAIAQNAENRRPYRRERLTRAQILAWADAHRMRTGSWPSLGSGPVTDAPGESWKSLNTALRSGIRGLPGGTGLSGLLRLGGRIGERRGRPPKVAQQRLIADMHAEGFSLAEIGRWLGISRQAAWAMVQKGWRHP